MITAIQRHPSTLPFNKVNGNVTSYIDIGNDETNDYTNYEFQFYSNGTVTATKTGSTINGTWSSGNDDSRQKLYLTFSTSPLNELDADWHILSQSMLQIILEDISGCNGGIENMTFEKI